MRKSTLVPDENRIDFATERRVAPSCELGAKLVQMAELILLEGWPRSRVTREGLSREFFEVTCVGGKNPMVRANTHVLSLWRASR